MKHSKIMSVFSVCCIAAVVLRILQLRFLIDGDTGFAKTGLGNTRCLILTYVLMIVCAAVTAFVTTYSSKRQPTQAPDIKQCKAIVPAAFLIVVYNAYSLISLAVSGNLSKIRLLLAVLLLLNIVFFTLYGASAFVNIRVPAILSIIPVLLSGYRLIEEFLSYNGVVNISENLFTIGFMCFQTVFFLLHAKILCNTEVRRSCRLLLPVSAFTFGFSAVCTLPSLLIYMFGGAEKLHNFDSSHIGFIIIGIYALVFTMFLYSKKRMPRKEFHTTATMDRDPNETVFYTDEK